MTIAAALERNVRVLDIDTSTTTRSFSSMGEVVAAGDQLLVHVGDTLLGQFGRDDVVERDRLLTTLAQGARIHLGRVAAAFGISAEMLRRIRRTHRHAGIAALVARSPRGGRPRLGAKQRTAMERRFDSGESINDVLATQGKKGASHSAIGRVHRVHAFERLFETVNTWNLTLPGDDLGRRLVFTSQLRRDSHGRSLALEPTEPRTATHHVYKPVRAPVRGFIPIGPGGEDLAAAERGCCTDNVSLPDHGTRSNTVARPPSGPSKEKQSC